MIIKRNQAKCLKCGEIIESKHHHDFVSCKCDNVSVDGGHVYLRRAVRDLKDYQDLSEYIRESDNEISR